MNGRPSVNKYVLMRNDGLVTGLVAADSMQEAQDDAQRFPNGTIITQDDWLASPEHAQQKLDNARVALQALIDVVVGGFNKQFLYMDDSALTTEGLARKAVAQYGETKKADIASWSQSQIDNYDPVSDPNLQV